MLLITLRIFDIKTFVFIRSLKVAVVILYAQILEKFKEYLIFLYEGKYNIWNPIDYNIRDEYL